MRFESHLGHSVSAGQTLVGFRVLTNLDVTLRESYKRVFNRSRFA
jgi:hypothetical protein